MAFYENKVEHYGGSLVLFQRNLAVVVPNSKTHRKPTWSMRLKIGGREGYVTRSTKLTIYEDAYEFAKRELLRLQQAAMLGTVWMSTLLKNTGTTCTGAICATALGRMSVPNGTKCISIVISKIAISNRDSSSMLLSDITPQFAAGYWDWRKGYWTSENSAKLHN